MGNDKKLLVFDVDGTLAPHGEPISRKVAEALCELERRGHVIAFASGKSAEYLEGLARGIGLVGRCLIAENGGVIFIGGKIYLTVQRPLCFDHLQSEIVQLFPQARVQHNMVNLTVMAVGETLEAVAGHLRSAGVCDNISCLFFLHSDAAELLPEGVDKGRALRQLASLAGFNKVNVVAAGNAENDVAMRGEAAVFLAVGDDIEADRHFADAPALLAYLLEVCI